MKGKYDMYIVKRLKQTKLAEIFKRSRYYKDCRRLYWCCENGFKTIKYLLLGRVWIDKVDVCITTKCNLKCIGCNHLITYYKNPCHLDKEGIIASLRKLSEATDWFYHLNILGGEPFLNPDLKYILEEVPSEKCDVVQIVTNATIIPSDPELFDVMRRKKVVVLMSQYPLNEKTQKNLIETLDQEGIAHHEHNPEWTDFGEPRNYHHSKCELRRQFFACKESCHNLLNGVLYPCFRSSHGYSLGLLPRSADEYVNLLNNTEKQNRKQIRRLIWRHKPLIACQYCLRGTDKNVGIVRGEQMVK